MSTKICHRCKKRRPLPDGFYTTPAGNPRNVCKECIKARARHYYYANLDDIKLSQYWRRVKATYGVSREQVEKAIDRQGGLCAICEQPFSVERRPHIDHCHKTKIFRGVLCGPCNLGLGHFKDDVEVLKRAIVYLRRPHRQSS